MAVTFQRDREFTSPNEKILLTGHSQGPSQPDPLNSQLDRSQDANTFTDVILPNCPSALYFVCMSVGVSSSK